MKIAHLIPATWCSNYELGDYRFALAQWIMQSKGAYSTPMTAGKYEYMIIDNGAFEGQLLSDDELLKAAEQIKADEIVLPDVPGDAKATLSASYKAFKKFNKFRTMFVPHGQSLEEWIECVDAWVAKISEATTGYHAIGISPLRYLDGGYKHTKEMIEHVITLNMPIHLLGLADMTYFTSELLPNLNEWNIRGIDTSYAFALGAKDMVLSPTSPKVNLGDISQYDSLSTNQRRLVALNIAILNSWIADGAVDSRGISDLIFRQTASKWIRFYQRQFERLEIIMRVCGVTGEFIIRDNFVRPYTAGDFYNKDLDWLIKI